MNYEFVRGAAERDNERDHRLMLTIGRRAVPRSIPFSLTLSIFDFFCSFQPASNRIREKKNTILSGERAVCWMLKSSSFLLFVDLKKIARKWQN